MMLFTDAYTTQQLIFHWRDAEAVELNEELELPQFNLDKVSIVEKCVKKYQTGIHLEILRRPRV